MAQIKKEDFLQLLRESPKGTTPEQLRDKLLARGHTFEGYTAPDSLKVIEKQQQEGKRGLGGFFTGVIKGGASTISNVSSLGQKALEKITGVKSVTPTLNESIGETLKPQGTAEKIGFGTEQIGEFLIPGGAATKAGKAVEAVSGASKLAKAAKVGAVAATEAVTAGGITGLQGGDKKDIVTAGIVGGATTGLASGISKLYKTVFPTPSIEKAVGQIAQGKVKDVPVFSRALDLIKTKGVKTYQDLQSKFDDIIPVLSNQVDDELLKDTGTYGLQQLVLKGKNKAGKEILTDYISRALNNLSEMYGKIGDDIAKSNIDDTILKATKEGLTRKEVNDISRIYGVEFGRKAFGKLGEPLTGVNAQAFENTRKGLKLIARQGLGGKEAQLLDSKLSDIFDAKVLVDKNVEAVNALRQKVQERNILEKLGGNASKIINTLTGNTLRGFITGIFPSNVGNKAMNALAIEEMLKKNLKIINKALNTKSDNELVKILQTLSKALIIKGSTEINN